MRADEVSRSRGRVLDTADIERVHDMRVATRRLRAVMEIFAPCFPKKQHRRALKEVKALADALGERRDPDVTIEACETVAAPRRRATGRGIRHLERALRAEQAGANERAGRDARARSTRYRPARAAASRSRRRRRLG